MYKSIFLFCFILIYSISCRKSNPYNANLNQETIIEDEKMLLGAIDRNGLQFESYKHWFDSTYQAYVLQDKTFNLLKSRLNNVEIKAFMATWCSDTQRDLPALYRILDKLEFDENKLQLVAVDRSKTKPDSLLEGFGIELVPTFIFYKNQQEVGRIEEIPNKTLEEDILAILSSDRKME